MTSWTPPQVEVVRIQHDDGVTLVSLQLGHGMSPPLAPTSLRFDDGTTATLDALVSLDGRAAVFRVSETLFDGIVCSTAHLQQWWTPAAFFAVTDLRRSWVHETPSTDHEHCLLDWMSIGSHSDAATGLSAQMVVDMPGVSG